MLVVDASALVDLLLVRPHAADIERHLTAHAPELRAPELLDVEVASALRRVVRAGEATVERAADALEDLLALPIERHRHRPLLPRVWELRATLTAYDATYLALAEAAADQPASLLTTDGAFARAITAQSEVTPLLVR